MKVKELIEFGSAHQVMFYDGEGMCSGVMVGEKIVCGCCGAVFEVDEVIENAKVDGAEAIRLFPNWVDMSEEIQGDTSEHCDWEGTVLVEVEE